jgi:hypothetical protein
LFDDSSSDGSPPPLLPETPDNETSSLPSESLNIKDTFNFDMEKGWEEALASVNPSRLAKNVEDGTFTTSAHARFAHGVQPIAYTEASEPVFQDRFEALLFFAYHRGAEDLLDRVQKALDEASAREAHSEKDLT